MFRMEGSLLAKARWGSLHELYRISSLPLILNQKVELSLHSSSLVSFGRQDWVVSEDLISWRYILLSQMQQLQTRVLHAQTVSWAVPWWVTVVVPCPRTSWAGWQAGCTTLLTNSYLTLGLMVVQLRYWPVSCHQPSRVQDTPSASRQQTQSRLAATDCLPYLSMTQLSVYDNQIISAGLKARLLALSLPEAPLPSAFPSSNRKLLLFCPPFLHDKSPSTEGLLGGMEQITGKLNLGLSILSIRMVCFGLYIMQSTQMSVSSREQAKEKYSKKMQDYVNRFGYYSANVRESCEVGSGGKTIQQMSHLTASIASNQYHYLRQKRESYNHQANLTKSLLTAIARESLVPKQAKIRDPLLLNSQTSCPSSDGNTELVDIFVTENMERNDLPRKHRMGLDKNYRPSSRLDNPELKVKDFHVYVIHFPAEGHSLWSYFVEKITLRENHLDSNDASWPIEYEAVISFSKEDWFQKNITRLFMTSPQMLTLTSLTQEAKLRMTLFESTLAKDLSAMVNVNMEGQKDVHLDFKRESRLPLQEYKKFENLRGEVYRYFEKLNPNRKLNPYFLDNLVCRFLVVNKYDEEESLKGLRRYLDWEHDMRSKYTIDSFKEVYFPIGVFTYLGKDYEGRPVILFRAEKYVPDELENINEYIAYNSYLFELFTQDQMEGYIDEYIIIADYHNFGKVNFRYGPAKEFADLSGWCFPGRQHKLILFGVATFGEWIYKVLKPVLPDFVISKISIYGNDRAQLRRVLEPILDLKQMPKYVFEGSDV